MMPKGHKFTPERAREIAAKAAETRARNREAAAAKGTPEERLAHLRSARERYAAAARRGWRTRRTHLGQDPDRRAPPAKAVRIFAADLEAVRPLDPDPKRAVHLALEGLAWAVEVGAIRWTGDGWAACGPQDGHGEANGPEGA